MVVIVSAATLPSGPVLVQRNGTMTVPSAPISVSETAKNWMPAAVSTSHPAGTMTPGGPVTMI